jgi:hypothetical protein
VGKRSVKLRNESDAQFTKRATATKERERCFRWGQKGR